jgi:chromosome segregation ATPase
MNDIESPVKKRQPLESQEILSFASDQKNKDSRVRVAIKKLLESEAERNEDLKEENQVIEKQIKALVLLLVEKDEKIKGLKVRKVDKRLNKKFAFQRIFYRIQGILNKKKKIAVLRILNRREWKKLEGVRVALRNEELKKRLFWGFRVFERYFRVFFKDLAGVQRVLKKNLRIYFKTLIFPCKSMKISKVKNFSRLISLFQSISTRRSFLSSWFKLLKRKTLPVKTESIKNIRNFLCFRLQRTVKTYLKSIIFNLKTFCENLNLHSLKTSHKSFLSSYKKNTQQDLNLQVLNFIYKKKITQKSSHFLNKWKKKTLKINLKSFNLQKIFSKILQKRLNFFFRKSSKKRLPTKLFLIFSEKTWQIFRLFQRLYRKNRILAYKKHFSESLESCISAKDTFETLESKIEKSEIESRLLSHKVSEQSSELRSLESLCSENNVKLKTLKQNLLEKHSKLETLLHSPLQNQNLSTLEKKSLQQVEYLEAASSKLHLLQEKHEKLTQENLSIENHSKVLQQSIENSSLKYTKIIEESKSRTDQRSDVQSLSQTSNILEEELKNLSFLIKNTSSDLKLLKEKILEKNTETLQQEIFNSQAREEEVLFEVNRLESELSRENEGKEKQLQEISSEITHVKEQLKFSKDDIEKLKNFLKESAGKVKNLGKITEDLNVLKSNFESGRKKLTELKEINFLQQSNLTSLQKKSKELEFSIRSRKDDAEKRRIEISLLENKLVLSELSSQESQKQLKTHQKSKEDLETYTKTLEQQVFRLEEACSKQVSQDITFYTFENAGLSQKVERLEQELLFFNEETAQRRREVAEVKPEIENYRVILAAMEEKIAENELKLKETQLEKQRIQAETKILKERLKSLSIKS